MEAIVWPGHMIINGNLIVQGSMPSYPRTNLLQDDNAVYPIPWTAWRVWDALSTNLPGAGAADDLGLVGGTFGTGTPTLQTGDVKAAGAVTRYARCHLRLPPEYVGGQSVTLRFHAGMLTTLSDGPCTVDVEVFKCNREGGVTGTDLCATNATSIKSLTLTDKDFTITPNALLPGDELDIKVAIASSDGATATAVIGIIGSVQLLLDIKG